MENNSINQVLLISSPINGQIVGIKSLKRGDIIGRAGHDLYPKETRSVASPHADYASAMEHEAQ